MILLQHSRSVPNPILEFQNENENAFWNSRMRMRMRMRIDPESHSGSGIPEWEWEWERESTSNLILDLEFQNEIENEIQIWFWTENPETVKAQILYSVLLVLTSFGCKFVRRDSDTSLGQTQIKCSIFLSASNVLQLLFEVGTTITTVIQSLFELLWYL